MREGPSMRGLPHIQGTCSKLRLVVTLTMMTTHAAPVMLMHLAVPDPLLASAQQLIL